MAVVIAVASLVVSNMLTRDLAVEERAKMEVWAEAMRALSQADESTDLSLVLKVIDENNTIPVVVVDADGEAQFYRNIDLSTAQMQDSLKVAAQKAAKWKEEGQYVSLLIGDEADRESHIDVCYDDSVMLKRLQTYPLVQLGVVMIFVVVAIFALLTSKRAEQNKVWVGLSKETAHQLGTPISSLMAWTEVLKETYPDDALLPEMEKDVQRLRLIADRFSKIGSLPKPVPSSLNEVTEHVVDYMNRRTSSAVTMSVDQPEHEIILPLNSSLFEWVIENLCKNAVDAMGEDGGSISLHVTEKDERVIIDVEDSGKGIPRKDIKNVFRPGFTTKKRGWGLGLSLAKRIVEEYHHGKIYVKASEVGRGTTFRIELQKHYPKR